MIYLKGSCETSFKKRIINQKKSFQNKQYKKETKLSKEEWNLKSTNNRFEIAWKTVRRCALANRAIRRCNLCLNEKLEIAAHQERNLLNKRSELVSKYRHFNKLLLINFDDSVTQWQDTNVPFYCPQNPLIKL